ncbi:MAG: RluA family pseudouridine synthase [Alphaproteobacteria bacterium]|nr:RluA family pseudouridine synthase [Alphaproteobacteria bacterium]
MLDTRAMTVEDDDEPDDAGEIRRIIAPPDAAGQRVDQWLVAAWPDLSRARIQGLIGQGRLSADGAAVPRAAEKAAPGAVYALVLPPPEPAAPTPEAIPLTVVFEDAHLIVIDKPAGMAVHPAPGSMRGTLVNALLAHCAETLSGVGGVARPGIVHRIDKDTTGLVVAAKSDAAHRGLAKLFARHQLDRAYYAIVRGAPHPRSGTLETRIARSRDDRKKFAVVRDPESDAGKTAITHYWTIETFGQRAGESAGHPAAAFVECRLETGRTHQIRVHLAHLGCPIVGDPLYGKGRAFKAISPHAEEAAAAVSAFPRQALHAAVLGFKHPVTNDELRFESPPPADMQALLRVLRTL